MIVRSLFVILTFPLISLSSSSAAQSSTPPADGPLARIVVIANPYITSLPADQIKDERGVNRGFLAATSPASMKRTVELVNRLRPDALVVLGSVSWSARAEEFAAFAAYLKKIECRKLIVPGHRDRFKGSLQTYQRYLSQHDVSQSVCVVKGVGLAFGDALNTAPNETVHRLEKQLAAAGASSGVLLFAARDRTMGPSRLNESHAGFRNLVRKYKIALRMEPSRYDHQVAMSMTLPLRTIGSTSWATRGSVTLVQVFSDRVEVQQVEDLHRPAFSLTVPNPVQGQRLSAWGQDPFKCPSYSEDLKLGPDFTFALVSDPQFDRLRNREALIRKSQEAIVELNRLKPALVFVAGDLVNNNLPEEWKIFRKVFSKLQPPRYVVPGNHDVLFNYEFVEKSYADAATRNPQYAALVAQAIREAKREGYNGPTALYEKFTGSKPRQTVIHKKCAFLLVPFMTTRADAGALRFLRQRLLNTKDKEHVFVVAHYPALPAFGNSLQPTQGGSVVLGLLSEFRVSGFLFGHRHRNGFRLHERTAHVLTDNMSTIHLLHVFKDRIVIGRKRVGAPLYERLTIKSPR